MGFFLFDAATFIASYAFPILPYELFLIMPWALAYFAEGGRVQLFTLKIETLVVFMTYWGAIYGAEFTRWRSPPSSAPVSRRRISAWTVLCPLRASARRCLRRPLVRGASC